MKTLASLLFIIAAFQPGSNHLAVVVANETENAVYLGVETPLQALIENSAKKSVILTTDNGDISKMGDNRFAFVPASVGIANVNFCKLVKKDTVLIGNWQFRVRQLPDPAARIGRLSSGPFKKGELIKMGGVVAKLECCGFDYPVAIDGYTFIAMRDSSIIATSKSTGPRYSKQALQLLQQLQPTDHLIVCGLTVKMPSQTRILHPMEFVIEE